MKKSKETRSGYKVLVALAVLVIVSLACGGGGGDDGEVVVTPTPVNVGDESASEIVENINDAIEDTNTTLEVISELNCKLGFDSCNENVEDLGDVITPE